MLFDRESAAQSVNWHRNDWGHRRDVLGFSLSGLLPDSRQLWLDSRRSGALAGGRTSDLKSLRQLTCSFSCFNCTSQIEPICGWWLYPPPYLQYTCVKCMAQTDKEKQDKYLQCFQANEACNCEAINDVFLAGNGLSLPPPGRPVPSESRPTFSPTRTQDTVGSTRLPIWAWGQGCGPFPG